MGIDERFLRGAVATVEDHLTDDAFDVDRMAAQLGISRSSLYRRLRSLKGQTPARFVRSIRLKKAAQLLRSGSLSITEVVYEVGYGDVSHFYKHFRQEFGCPPGQYAAKHAGQANRSCGKRKASPRNEE